MDFRLIIITNEVQPKENWIRFRLKLMKIDIVGAIDQSRANQFVFSMHKNMRYILMSEREITYTM